MLFCEFVAHCVNIRSWFSHLWVCGAVLWTWQFVGRYLMWLLV